MASKRDPPTSADCGSYSGVANNDSDIHSSPRKTMKENHTLLLPFHLKCGGCGTIIAKGVALKIKRVEEVGTYRNRQIRSFTLKCLCGQMIEVDEVPPKDEYKVATGGCELEESEYSRWSNKPPQSTRYCDGVNVRWTDQL